MDDTTSISPLSLYDNGLEPSMIYNDDMLNSSSSSNLNYFTKFHSDIMFHIISYCNIRDSGQFAVTNRRHYFSVHQYRIRRGPEFVASISNIYHNGTTTIKNSNTIKNATTNTNHKRMKISSSTIPAIQQPQQQLLPTDVCYNAIQQIQTIPKIAFGFCKEISTLPYDLPSYIPNETIICCAKTKNIQTSGVIMPNSRNSIGNCNHSSCYSSSGGDNNDDDDNSNIDVDMMNNPHQHSTIECASHSSVFLSNMPNAKVTSFAYHRDQLLGISTSGTLPGQPKATKKLAHQLSHQLLDSYKQDHVGETIIDRLYYKMFIIYACGDVGSTEVDMFVKTLQQQFPKAIIVGGICLEAYVSIPITKLNDLFGSNISAKHLIRKYNSDELLFLYQTLGGAYQETNKNQYLSNLHQAYFSKVDLAEKVSKLIHEKIYNLVTIEDGICGIALGGNVPVHSIVSRGVVSRTAAFYKHSGTNTNSSSSGGCTPPPSQTSLYVAEAEYVRYGDTNYMFDSSNNEDGDDHHHPPYHIIRKIIDINTNRSYTPSQLHEKFGQGDLLGIRKVISSSSSNCDKFVINETTGATYENGFTLETPHDISRDIDAYVLIADDEFDDEDDDNNNKNHSMDQRVDDDIERPYRVSSLIGANIDFYDLDGPACVYDMDDAMACLKEQTKHSTILGGIMFSCNGRGPNSSSMISIDMADATIFEKYFPKIQCVGMYAYGEIGPIALAGTIRRQDQQQQTSSSYRGQHQLKNDSKVRDMVGNPPPYQQYTVFNQGNSCLQGFTAVFSLFIVPNEYHKEQFDDSTESIEAFIQKQLIKQITI